MRKKLLSLLAMVLVTITASAQWTKPTVENVFTPVEPESGQTYMVYNVVAGRFLTAAGYWGSQASLVPGTNKNKTTTYPTQFKLVNVVNEDDATQAGWTFEATTDIIHRDGSVIAKGKPMFRADASGVYLDMASQGNQYWVFRPQGDNIVRIQQIEANTTYGVQIIKDGDLVPNEAYEKEYFGWKGNSGDMLVYGNVDPATEGAGLDWMFVDPATYTDDAKKANEAALTIFAVKDSLYNLYKIIVDESLTTDYTAYNEAYNGDDLEAARAALAALDEAVAIDRAQKILDGATVQNPKDATILLTNPSFDTGSITGWTSTGAAPAFNTATGNGVNNGGSMQDEDVTGWGYDCEVYHNKFDLSQKLKKLRPGLYKFTCQGFYRADDGEGATPAAELYAVVGEEVQTASLTPQANGATDEALYLVNNNSEEFSSDKQQVGEKWVPNSMSGAMYHFHHKTGDNTEFDYTSTLNILLTEPTDITVGVRTTSTHKWVIFDNFTITYYGNDPYVLLLPEAVEQYKETYDNMGDARAQKDSLDNFESAYEAAKQAVDNNTGDFEALYNALHTSYTALQNSIADYEEFKSILDKWAEKSERAALAGDKWSNVSAQITGKISTYTDNYNEGTYTREQIDAVDNELGVFYAEEIGKLVSKGDDISFLLENTGFDNGNANGWTVTGGIQFGGYPVSYNNAEGAEVVLNSAVCEAWRSAFSISQVIKNMPKGLYTLSAQAFVRDEDAQATKNRGGEFFAGMGADTLTATLKSIHDEATPTAQEFTPGTGAVGTEADADRGFGFIPNGRCGANVRFALGQYKNFFDIEMKEIGDIEVGVRVKENHFWCLFDDFKIVYKGNDAEAYQETIERLASKIQDMENDENALWTNEAYEKCEQALNAAQQFIENIKSKTTEDALALRDQLEGAIADAEASLAKTAELKALWTEYSEYRMNPMDYEGDPDDAEYLDLMTNTLPALIDQEEEINTDAEVLTYMDKIVKGYAPYLQSGYTEASKDNPNNLTAVITNPDCMGYGNGVGEAVGAEGWEVTVGKVGYGSDGGDTPNGNQSVIEFFQTDFDIHQTIYGLKPGYYELGVSGFYRDGSVAHIDSCMNHYDGKEENHYVKLYADSKQEDLLVISKEAADYTMFLLDSGDEKLVDGEGKASSKNGTIKYVVGEGDEPETEEYYIPNTIYAAQAAFDAELYQNKLVFQIKEEQESVTIGLRKEHNGNIEANEDEGIEAYNYNDWTPFNYWTLAYWGTELPDHIQGVEVQKTVAKDVIYNVAGQRVQKAVKGLYIINGKKVLVK